MSSSIPIIQSLTSIANSPNYCQAIPLFTKMEYYQAYGFEYESISNNIEIIPPSVWFNIEEAKCFASIRNDIERSRITREGLLSTSLKGNLLNKITYQGHEEDIGAIQEMEQSFCVAFAVVKDNCEDFLKQIGVELRACLIKKSSLIDRSHLKISQLDEISKEIYSRFRVFLIFDTKSQPGRIVSFHSCFYPNVRFTMERVKKKEGAKFTSNEVLQQIQRGQLMNTFGYLSLDTKQRFLLIKKDDPQLQGDNLLGVWVISSYQSNRTKKEFSKEDAFWVALMKFYTNPEVKIKLSMTQKPKGLLCYFGFKKQKGKIDIPEFYLFEPNLKQPPKWNFAIKNQVLSDSNKSCEVKIQFMNSTIVEEREYSEFSDQTNNYEESRIKNENFNRENLSHLKEQRMAKNYPFQGNESGLSGSSQGKNSEGAKNFKFQEQDQKSKIIKQLKDQLQKCKQRIIELEAVNKVLMHEKTMNSLMYQPQFAMMNQMSPVFHQFNPMPNYSFPLSYSQVSSQSNFQPQADRGNNSGYFPQQNAMKEVVSNSSKINQVRQPEEPQKKPAYSFPEVKEEELTFGTQKNNQGQPKPKLFVKKSQSYGPQLHNDQPQKKQPSREEQKQKVNSESVKQVNPKKDLRNISFQDSFAEYHSEGQQEGPTFKTIDSQKFVQFLNKKDGSAKKKEIDDEGDHMKSPQFKRIHSLKTQPIVHTEQYEVFHKAKETKKEQELPKRPLKIEEKPKEKEIKLEQKKSPEKPSLKQETPVQRKFNKKDDSSNESEEQQKLKIKPEVKKESKKPIKISSDSDDSDEDLQMKKIRMAYLNR